MTQITLSDGAGTYDFTGAPPASLYAASPGLSGAAYFGADVGSYAFGPVAPQLIGPLAGGNFPANFDQIFSYAGPGGSAVVGNVHWNLAKDDSPNPDLIGDLVVGSSSGNVATDFTPGSTAHIDLVLAFVHPSPFLNVIATTTDTTWTAISAGEIVPQSSVVSEPGTLALLGIALLVAGWGRGGKVTFPGRRQVV